MIIWLSINSKVSISIVVGHMNSKTPFQFEENAVISGNSHGNSRDTAVHCSHRHRDKVLLEHWRCQQWGSQKLGENRSVLLLLYSKSMAWYCSSSSSSFFFIFFWFHMNWEQSLDSKCITSPVSCNMYQCVNTGFSLHGLFCFWELPNDLTVHKVTEVDPWE